MKKKLFWKRSISMLLSVLMVVSVIQFVGVTTVQAEPTNATSYITMPITIRDFAADGMLFEFNQVGATGTTVVGTETAISAKVNPSTFNNDNYSWVCVFNNRSSQGNDVGIWWLDIYVNEDGTINIPKALQPYMGGKTIIIPNK